MNTSQRGQSMKGTPEDRGDMGWAKMLCVFYLVCLLQKESELHPFGIKVIRTAVEGGRSTE